jgi:hypothetical protein
MPAPSVTTKKYETRERTEDGARIIETYYQNRRVAVATEKPKYSEPFWVVHLLTTALFRGGIDAPGANAFAVNDDEDARRAINLITDLYVAAVAR